MRIFCFTILYPLYCVYSVSPFIKMDFSSGNQYDDSSKENVPPGFDAAAVQRSKQRMALGVLSENEQHGPSLAEVSQPRNPLLLFSVTSLQGTYIFMFCLTSVSLQANQFSKHSSASDRSYFKPSSSSVDICVEEACEVVLTASGQPLDSDRPDAQFSTLENEDARLLLGLISS